MTDIQMNIITITRNIILILLQITKAQQHVI